MAYNTFSYPMLPFIAGNPECFSKQFDHRFSVAATFLKHPVLNYSVFQVVD